MRGQMRTNETRDQQIKNSVNEIKSVNKTNYEKDKRIDSDDIME